VHRQQSQDAFDALRLKDDDPRVAVRICSKGSKFACDRTSMLTPGRDAADALASLANRLSAASSAPSDYG
jgi:hypothetical protein